MTRTQAWTLASSARPTALFAAHAATKDDVLVVAAAGGVAGHGAIGIIAFFLPGHAHARMFVMTNPGDVS
ncbi:MAG: hypothetical protein AB7T06_17440 [Kofleriaceae bacterium]